VKIEVIRALGELGGAGVIIALRETLDDPEEQVRIAALKALGTVSSEAAKRILLDRIMHKDFRDKEFDEKKYYLKPLPNGRTKKYLIFWCKQ